MKIQLPTWPLHLGVRQADSQAHPKPALPVTFLISVYSSSIFPVTQAQNLSGILDLPLMLSWPVCEQSLSVERRLTQPFLTILLWVAPLPTSLVHSPVALLPSLVTLINIWLRLCLFLCLYLTVSPPPLTSRNVSPKRAGSTETLYSGLYPQCPEQCLAPIITLTSW